MHLKTHIIFLLLLISLAGCQTSTSASEAEEGTLLIAKSGPIVVAVSGAMGIAGLDEEGLSMVNAVQLAAEDFGGNIQGHPIKIIGVDSGCTSDGAVAAANEIVGRQDVVGVIGHMCSPECAATSDIYSQAGLSVISPSCEARSLTDPISHQPSFLRTMYSSEAEALVSATFAYNTLGARKVAIINDPSGNTNELVSDFKATYGSLGGEIAIEIDQMVYTAEWINQVFGEFDSSGIDLIYAPLEPFNSLFLIIHREYANRSIPILGSHRMASEWFLKQVSPQIEGIFATAPLIAPSNTLDLFSQRYELEFGAAPPAPQAALAYDAALMLLTAVDNAAEGNARTSLAIPLQEITNGLFLTTAINGATGMLTCTEWGQCGTVQPGVYQIGETGWEGVYFP